MYWRVVASVFRVIGVLLLLRQCHADDVASTSLSTVLTTSSYLTVVGSRTGGNGAANPRPIDKGLHPLYVMTSTFLNLIQPESKGDILSDPRFQNVFQEDLSEGLTTIKDSITTDWQFWMRHYVGFAICAAVGVVFILVMPIVALCFCLCRCCGRCGLEPRSTQPEKKKGDGCRRTCFGIFLLAINTLITAGLVCAFVTNELIREQTSTKWSSSFDGSDGSGLISTAVSSLQSFSVYQNTTVQDMNTTVMGSLQQQIQSINANLDNFANKSIDRLSQITNIRGILNVTATLANTIRKIGRNLELVQLYSTQLQQQQVSLNDSVTRSRVNMLDALPADPVCVNSVACARMRATINGLAVEADFRQVQNVTSQAQSLQDFINGNVQDKVDEGSDELNNFTIRIQSQAENQITDQLSKVRAVVNDRGDKIRSAGQKIVDDVSSVVQSVNLDSTVDYLSETVAPEVDKFGNYRYYIGIGLSSSLVLIVTMVLLGLCFGICGEPADVEAGACNRGTGACFLMAGVTFTFLFVWLLMVAVVVLFVTGGATYTEACRPIVEQKDAGVVRIANTLLALQLNRTGLSLNIQDLMTRCDNNDGIYTALNLEALLNLTGLFDSTRNEIKNAIDGLVEQIKPNLSSVDFIDPSVFTNLAIAKDFAIKGIDFSTFELPLNQQLVSANLSSFVTAVRNDANQAPLTNNQKLTIINETEKLQTNTAIIIQSMTNVSNHLNATLTVLQSQMGPIGAQSLSNQIQALIDTLNVTQNIIRLNSTAIIKQFVGEFAQNVYDSLVISLSDLKNKIRNNIGQCRPLYNAVSAVTISVCQSFLYPFNGFWFSVGWCVFFSIPSIILSVKLAGLYRRTEDYYSANSKSFDEAHFNRRRNPPRHLNGRYDNPD